MQIVTHAYTNVSPIFDDIEKYYSLVSDKAQTKPLFSNTFDKSFKLLDALFYDYADLKTYIRFTKKKYPKLSNNLNNNMIVCFSGGKDSIANALYYIEHDYNVYLYHMRHINPALSDEYIYMLKNLLNI